MLLPTLATWLLVSSQERSAEQIYESATPSVLTLSVDRPHGTTVIGTAFLAVRKGVAVTAWHVLRGARHVTAKFSDGHDAKVLGVIDKDPALDIAMIAVESADRPYLQLAEGDPRVGSRAFVIGSPKGMDFSISDGIISQTPYLGSGKLFQFTCPVSPGNSGGPLLNGAGQVLGVVSWQLRDAQNLNFAVPAEKLGGLDATKALVPIDKIDTEPNATTEVLLAATDDLIKELLKQIDLSASASDDGTGKTAFLFDFEGTKASLFQYAKDGKSGPTVNLSMSSGYQMGAKADLARLNLFNRTHRFARCYRDSNGVVYLENDLDLEKGIGAGTFLRFVTDYQETLNQFESEVVGKDGGGSRTEDRKFKPRTPAADLTVSLDDHGLAEILKSCGFTVKAADDGTGKDRFSFKVGAVEAVLYQFTDDEKPGPTTSLTLSVGYDVGGKAELSKVNAFNEQTRFYKSFLDADGDPYFISDLDLQGGVTVETIKAFIKNFVSNVPAFEQAVLSKQ